MGTAVSLLVTTQATAGMWYFEPSTSVGFGYEDNVRLVTSNEDSAFSTNLNVNAPVGFRTEVSDVNLRAQLDSIRYDDLSDLNTDNQLLELNTFFRSGLDLFNLQGSYERDSTLTSELETTGLVQSSTRRIVKNLNPSWTRTLTERTSLQLDYQFTDVSYQNADLTDLVDYRFGEATAGMVYTLSENADLHGNLSVSKYDAPDADTEFMTYGLQAGVSFQVSDTLSASISVSPTHTKSSYLGTGGGEETSSDNAILLDLSVNKIYETMTVEGSLITSETPSGRGRMLRMNAVRLSLHRELSPRTTFSFQSNVYENTSTGGFDDDSDDRLYYSLEPRLDWQATRWWTISSAYRYRRQDYTNSSTGAADSNSVFITASYVWPRESLSH